MSTSKRLKTIPGSICAPRGFRAAAVFCDIKKLGTGKGSEKGRKLDLGLIVSDVPAAVAGTFTTNQVVAPPVKLSAARARRESARAIVVNSGNANACTGRQGMRDAEAMAKMTATAVAAASSSRRSPAKADDQKGSASFQLANYFRSQPGRLRHSSAVADRRYKGMTEDDVLVCSTGRIGVPLPMKNVARGIRACASRIERLSTSARQVAEAIMTSDTRRKEIAVEFVLGGVKVRIGGIGKGAGMIQPRMSTATATPKAFGVHTARRTVAKHATMLAFLTSDAAISSGLLKQALQGAVNQSFNRITVDGDMSTNDSVIMLANGQARNATIAAKNAAFRIFQEALNFVCLELAKLMVRDGEGVSRFVTLHVRGARTVGDAELAARAVANSSLVKTSWCGGDPNWGRILCALGYSAAQIDESAVDIGYSESGSRKIVYGFRAGKPTRASWKALTAITSRAEFDVHIELHRGKGDFVLYASDLTEDYVAFNKGDITDPSSLGG